jgi:hypothetical protein
MLIRTRPFTRDGRAQPRGVDSGAKRWWRLGPQTLIRAASDDPISSAIDAVFGGLCLAPGSSDLERARGLGLDRDALELACRPDARDGWMIFAGGMPTARVRTRAELAPMVEGALIGHAVRSRDDCAALHAAAVVIGERAALLLGEKGSGKSTLSVSLSLSGARFLGDEVAFIDFDDEALAPLPKAATIKAGAFSILREYCERLPIHADPVRGPLRYLTPPGALRGAARFEVAALVLPRWNADAERPVVTTVRAESIALELVRQSFGGLERDARTLALVASLASRPAFAVEFADAPGAARVLLERLEE